MGQMQLSANTPYRVCSDIAAKGTLNWTLPVGPSSLWGENESGFLCGIWFTPGFHAANPDLVITLEPRLYKYNVEDQSNPIDMGSLGNALHFPSPHVTIIPPTQAEPDAIVAAIDNGYLTTAATEPATIDYSSLLPNLSVEFNAAAVQQIATTAGDSPIKLKIKDVTESGVTVYAGAPPSRTPTTTTYTSSGVGRSKWSRGNSNSPAPLYCRMIMVPPGLKAAS